MRIGLLKSFFLIAFIIIIARLYYWQIVRSDDLVVMAEKQHLVTYQLDAPRGNIYYSDGNIMATNKPTFSLYALPKVVKNNQNVIDQLADIISRYRYDEQLTQLNQEQKYSYSAASSSAEMAVDSTNPPPGQTQEDLKKEITQSLTDKLSQDLDWVSLSKNLDSSVKDEIDNLKLDGLGFDDSLVRYYPDSSSSAHILGFVGSDQLGTETGYFGLEGYYDKELRGVGGQMVEERDARGVPILSGNYSLTDVKNGHDLVLNIDRSVQYITEKYLREGMAEYGAKEGSAVIMDPKSGAIIAMASYPNYDPNTFYNFPTTYYSNPITSESYEPGSTFKTVVMSAAINEGVVTPDTRCDICSGPVEASGYLVRTWNNQYFPNSTMSDVILHSDNTGMVFVARKLGLDKMYQYIQDFGFGQITGLDVQDESSPQLREKKDWKDIDLATAGFGQGIAVTPIQMVRAVAAIANKGVIVQPKIVKEVRADGKVIPVQSKQTSQPITENTAQIMTQMMVNAVQNGEAGQTAPKGYKIAGKTGTAQVPIEGHYEEGKYVASFIGFAPADDPKFVMLVKYNEPQKSIYGTSTAAPTFFKIAKELFVYYNIPPDMEVGD